MSYKSFAINSVYLISAVTYEADYPHLMTVYVNWLIANLSLTCQSDLKALIILTDVAEGRRRRLF